MKIAICFYGYFGKKNLKDITKLKYYDEDRTIKHFKKYIMQNEYDIDIFIHTWHVNPETDKKILYNYCPKDYIIENQEVFINKTNNNSVFNSVSYVDKCRYYSEEQTTKLMLKYQEKHNKNVFSYKKSIFYINRVLCI